MKLLTFTPPTAEAAVPRIGALLADGRTVVDLQAVEAVLAGRPSASFVDMTALLSAGEAGRERVERVVELAESSPPPGVLHLLDPLTLHAPVPRPRSIRDCMAFEKHLVGAMRTVLKWRSPVLAALDGWLERRFGRGFLRPPRVWYQQPLYYKGNVNSVIGHDGEVIWPSYTGRLDYELEFGVFIGRPGRDIPVDRAADFIAGYTIFNDFSARDIQVREMRGRLGPAKSKDFDTGNVMGPYLVTPDEIPNPYELIMEARVNGERWSFGTSAEMHFTFEQMIASISRSETLFPGDFIGSGTVPGGCGLELDRWLEPGDVVELEVEGLGVLSSRVVKGSSSDGSRKHWAS